MQPGDAISVIVFTTRNSDGTFSGYSSFNPCAISAVAAYGGATVVSVGGGSSASTATATPPTS
jgi:hypothetical protein